ncbi:hypothetical protein ES703_113130 [subsurface metagenome]
MPAGYVLHEVNALAFGSVSDNEGWFAFCLSGFLKSTEYLFHVMPIDFNYMPPEGAVFVGKRVNAHDVIDAAIYLESILINYTAQIVQFVMAGFHGCLPNLTLLLLPVTHETIYAVIFLIQPCGEGIPHGNR